MSSVSPAIISAVYALEVTKTLHFGCLALWIFEHLVTFDMEVAHIWKRQWSVIKVLFLIVKYSTYGDIVMNLLIVMLPPQSEPTCTAMGRAFVWCFATGIMSSDLIFTVRLWAFLKKSKKMAIFLAVIYISMVIATWILCGLFENSLQYKLQDLLREAKIFHFPCLPTGQPINLELAPWSILLAYNTAMLLLMLPPSYAEYKSGGRSRLVNTLIRDGIVFYFYLFVTMLVNVVLLKNLSPNYNSLLPILVRVIQSALACRVVLHLRDAANSFSEVNTVSGV